MPKHPDYTVTRLPAGLSRKLLQGAPAGPPRNKLLDYWATLSRCLTDLEVSTDPQLLLQPAYLNELTRLTRLSLDGATPQNGQAHEDDGPHYAFQLPELASLHLSNLWAGILNLLCPQLTRLHIEGCAISKLYLHASLKHLHYEFSAILLMHKGFPITNLIGLTYLSCYASLDIDSEAVLVQGLPLMTQLQFLELQINRGKLPASLPSSLRDLTMTFSANRAWDSSVIPLVQQLPEARAIRIYVETKRNAFIGNLSLDHDLMPFLAMTSLNYLVLGNPQVWKASALCQLGEVEAEVVRSGKKLFLRY